MRYPLKLGNLFSNLKPLSYLVHVGFCPPITSFMYLKFSVFAFLVTVAATNLTAQVSSTPGALNLLVENSDQLKHFTRPVISPDGKSLFFVNVDHDLHLSLVMHKEGDAFAPIRPELKFCPNHSGFIYQLINENTALVHDDDLHFNDDHHGLIIIEMQDDGWDQARGVKILDYKNESLRYPDFCMTPDGTTLFMALETDRGKGGLDLYYSTIDEFGRRWSYPTPVPGDMNTKGDDFCPFVSPDGTKLYFASNGKADSEGSDIYVADRVSTENWAVWSPSVKMGGGVNTKADEAYFSVPKSHDKGYFLRVATKGLSSSYQLYEVGLSGGSGSNNSQGETLNSENN